MTPRTCAGEARDAKTRARKLRARKLRARKLLAQIRPKYAPSRSGPLPPPFPNGAPSVAGSGGTDYNGGRIGGRGPNCRRAVGGAFGTAAALSTAALAAAAAAAMDGQLKEDANDVNDAGVCGKVCVWEGVCVCVCLCVCV